MSNTRVLVTGGGGQLSTELEKASWDDSTEVRVLNVEQLDITSADAVDSALADFEPHFVVNAAAYTAVDKAEEETELAHLVNVVGVENLVASCDEFNSALIHVSTDYVFDGYGLSIEGDRWRIESDPTNPINVYGETKLAGEAAALDLERSIVLRTSWVYSSHGHNFVKTMIKLAHEGKDLGVVNDQFGCPTAAKDLAANIVSIVQQGMSYTGLFHCASVADATWWDLADRAIAKFGIETNVRKITTDEYPLPAKRPLDTRIDSSYLKECYGVQCRPWTEALDEVVAELQESGFTK